MKEASLLPRINDGQKDVDREVHHGNDVKTHLDRAIAEARRQSAELQSHVARAGNNDEQRASQAVKE